MDLAQEIIDEIVTISQRLIDTLVVRVRHECGEFVEISRIQLAGDLHKVVATCLAIAETLKKSLHYGNSALDERLTDWLIGREPARCRQTLHAMAKLVRVDQDKGVWKWLPTLPSTTSSKVKMKEAITLFAEHRDHFHFLLTTDVWNLEMHAQRGLSVNLPADNTNLVVTEMSSLPRTKFVQDLQDDPMSIDTSTPDTKGPSREKNKEADLKQLEDILDWLGGLDCTEKHDTMIDLRQSDTCTWLPDTPAYKTWRHDEDSFLWLHGKPGAGKSVLIASVIDTLERSLDDGEVLAFFYCDFRSERSTSAAEVMCSLLSQLLHKLRDSAIDPGDVLDDLNRAKGRGGSVLKNVKQLSRLVSSVAKRFTRLPLLIIDALDECKDIQNLLDALVVLSQAKLRLFTASRPRQIIKDHFSDLPSISLEKMSAEVSADIQLHVTRELDSHRRLRIAPAKLKEDISNTLCKNADGMFRWIECQLNTLKRCVTPTDIREALERLPKGLEETYQQILLAIDKEAREAEAARRALTWLVAAYGPLRLSQMIEALSIDLDRRILDTNLAPIHGPALLDALSSLVTHDEDTDIVILSHFSVQEYLTGELVYTKLSAYHIDLQYAEGQLARFCMCYIATCLNQGQGSGMDVSGSRTLHRSEIRPNFMEISHVAGHHETNPSLESRPLLEYVFAHGFDHLAHVKPGDTAVLRALVALNDDVRRNLSAWELMRTKRGSGRVRWPTSADDFVFYILIAFATEPLLRSFLGRGSLQSKAGINPLVYAAQLDKITHAQTLLSRGAALNRRGLLAFRPQQVTPLEAAVGHGSSAVVNLILTRGGPVPGRIFAKVLNAEYLKSVTGACVAARLMQTDDFAEWALEVQDTFPLLGFLNDLDFTHKNVLNSDAWPKDKDIVTILRRLVQVGCDPFAHGSLTQTLFHQATAAGHVSTLKYILSLNIPPPPNILLCEPCTAKERIPPSSWTMRLLLDGGADIHATTSRGDTPLHVTLENSEECNTSEGDCLERVKLLTSAGCDPFAYNLNGETPLHFATSLGFKTVVQYIFSLRIQRPRNILLSASRARSGKASMIRYLIHNDADVLVASDGGDTMLHWILDCFVSNLNGHQGPEEDCLESAKLLVKAGCSPRVVNAVGDTPMDIALQTGHLSVVEYFLALKVPLPPDAILRASSVAEPSLKSLQLTKMLIEMGEDANVVSPDGDNALHRILSTYDMEYMVKMVKMLLDAGCDASARNAAGQTPLHIAGRSRIYEPIIVYLLSRGVPLPHDIMLAPVLRAGRGLHAFFLERGANPRAIAGNGNTALHCILENAFPDHEVLQLTKAVVRAGVNPLALNSAGETSLQIAVRRGFVSVIKHLLSIGLPLPSDILLTASCTRSLRISGIQIIRFLIEKGVATDVVTRDGDTALHLALSSGFRNVDDPLKVAQILIGAGCDARAQNLAGETALHAAATGGHLSAMEYLISQGVPFDPNILLVFAASDRTGFNKPKILRTLINKGADKRVTTSKGDTLLHLALAHGFYKTRLETAQVLVEWGCDPSQPNLAGNVPLHAAASSGFLYLVKYLLSLNAPLPSDILLAATAPLGKKNPGMSSSALQMFRLLVNKGANVHILAPNGDTLLHIVIRQGFKLLVPRRGNDPWEAVGFLLSAGCDPFVRNAEGQTAFDLAEAQGHLFFNNFVRLVNTYRDSTDLPANLQPSSSKRRVEDTQWDMVSRQAKRGRLDVLQVGEDDEIAEVDEQLMA